MTEIIGVRFQSGGKEYFFDPQGQNYHLGDYVIVDTASGIDIGLCARSNTQVEDDTVVQPLRCVLRAATDRDMETQRRNKEREKEAFRICGEKVAEYGLDMALVRCECSFDGNKLLFFFTSENRVDFRALVRDLASTLHARIELRQIGVRDETKLIGGLGICGRPYCCNGFLESFHPVSIKMAKTQGLSLNPAKISGACGRLMCCLQYEQCAYEDAVSRLPKAESFVETPDGAGTVTAVDFLRERVTVRLEDAPDAPQTYAGEEINIIRNGKGKRPEDYVQPPRAQLEKLRKVTPPPSAPEKPAFSSFASSLSDLSSDRGGERRQGGGDQRSRQNRQKQAQPQKGQGPKQGQSPKQAQQKQNPPKGQSQQPKREQGPKQGQGEPSGEPRAKSRNGNFRRHRRGGGGKGPGAGGQQPS